MKRIEWVKVLPEGYRALLTVSAFDRKSSVERSVRELVKLRVSQLNGCAYCVDMHSKELRAAGETDERLNMLVVWQEARCFTDRERAALAFAEAATTGGPAGVPDDVYECALTTFGEIQLAELGVTTALITAWNRLGVSFHSEPGHYRPAAQ